MTAVRAFCGDILTDSGNAAKGFAFLGVSTSLTNLGCSLIAIPLSMLSRRVFPRAPDGLSAFVLIFWCVFLFIGVCNRLEETIGVRKVLAALSPHFDGTKATIESSTTAVTSFFDSIAISLGFGHSDHPSYQMLNSDDSDLSSSSLMSQSSSDLFIVRDQPPPSKMTDSARDAESGRGSSGNGCIGGIAMTSVDSSSSSDGSSSDSSAAVAALRERDNVSPRPGSMKKRTVLTPPASPMRRNVSFSGLVTVKFIGSPSVGFSHLNTGSAVGDDADDELEAISLPPSTAAIETFVPSFAEAEECHSPLCEESLDRTPSGVVPQTASGVAMSDASNDCVASSISTDQLTDESPPLDKPIQREQQSAFLRYTNGAEFYDAPLPRTARFRKLLAATLRCLLRRRTVLMSCLLYGAVSALLTVTMRLFWVWSQSWVNCGDGLGLSLEELGAVVISSTLFSFGILAQYPSYVAAHKFVKACQFGAGIFIAGCAVAPTAGMFAEALKTDRHHVSGMILGTAVLTAFMVGGEWMMCSTMTFITHCCYSHERGTVFGIAETVGSLCQVVLLVIMSSLFWSFSKSSVGWPFNSALVWYLLAIIAVVISKLVGFFPKAIEVSAYLLDVNF